MRLSEQVKIDMTAGQFRLAYSARALAFAWAFSAFPAHAQSVEQFYSGKTISLIAPADPGGSYDMHLRVMARHVGKFIPGRPNAIVQNMLGAGGLRASNYVYERAPRDGTVLGMPVQENVIADVIGSSEVRFQVSDFNWIGRLTASADTIVVWHTLGVRSVDDARHKEIIIGATGPASGTSLYPWVMNSVVGTRFKVITGYKHTDTLLAVERGETQGAFSSVTTIQTVAPTWFTQNKVYPIVMIAPERVPEFASVPTLVELGRTPEDRQVLAILASATTVGRSIMTTPGVPRDRLAALRAAFDAMLKDTEFKADFAKTRTEFAPMSGEDLQGFIEQTRKVSSDVLARARAAAKR